MTELQLRSLQPQTLLGERYRLEREIGRGGMAVVWLARDLKLNRDVAIKVLLGELAFAMGPERFRREIDVVSRLSHPYILAIDDFGEYEGHLYYVMQFISGETIHKRLERERQLPLPDALRIAYQVASALDYAHKQGIVHRDIKPENILLQNGEALVADFGIARAITEGGGSKLTSTGVTLGTPTYMSPEQAMADPGIDGRSDIYSLGCVLYEMIAGQPPFSGPTAQSIIARHALGEVPSLVVVRGTVPEEVEDVVLQALAKSPADRFATAGDMAEVLRGLMATGSTGARNTAGRRRTTQRGKARQAKPGWKRYALIAAIAVPVLAAAAWTGIHFTRGGTRASRVGTDTDPNRLAVLYFDDQSDGGKLRFLADGLTESLIDELSKVSTLKVISRNGVAPFKGKSVPPGDIQKQLKIGTLVSGAVAQEGDRLRVQVRLIDALTGNQIDSKTIDRPRANLFDLQDALAKEVAGELRTALGKEVDMVANQSGTSNSQAWEGVQKVRQEVDGVDNILATSGVEAAVLRLTAADSELAAIEGMDRKWSTPIVMRGFIAHRKALLLGNGDPSALSKWLGVASQLADSSVAIAPDNADALELRGTIRYFRWAYNQNSDPSSLTKLLDAAEGDFRAAVKGNPLQATAWNGLSFILNVKARFSEAKLAAQQAYESDPYLKDIYKTIWRLFQNSIDMNNRTEAEKWCKVGRDRLPNDYRFTECRVWMYTLQGEKPAPDSIWKAYKDFLDHSPASVRQFNSLRGGMLVALGLVRAGLPDSARHVAERSRGNPQLDPGWELKLYEAKVRAQLGDKPQAVQLLRDFFANNPAYLPYAKDDNSWWWDPIKDFPAYKELIGAH